ncbi:hypothetical protein NDA16_003309 [Ustilago loliicola]|nr:hypothetical protein NDA16_003309 [Ustilago loliicola]
MISASSSQALLARTALRGVRTAAAVTSGARIASAALVASTNASRRFSVSSIPRQAAVVDTPANTAAADADADAPVTITNTDFPVTTLGRKKRNRPITVADKAKFLVKWAWFEPDSSESKQLFQFIHRGWKRLPEWVSASYDEARRFRSARARLWTPTLEHIRTFASDSSINDPALWVESQLEAYRDKLEAADAQAAAARKNDPEYDPELEVEHISQVELWDMMDYEQQVDFALRSVWQAMSEEQRSAALLRLRYESIRKLGWRQGYSSGYPRPESESSHLPAKLGAKGEQGWTAFRALQAAEEKEAWEAWQKLTPEQRVAEEKAAWTLRDRSQVYLDDSDDSFILGSPAPRWYPVPERAGELTFLPNTVIKLVKNHVPEGQEYDPFKATFRVPLSMHKHALRSYLLSIYGLKTTWARSSIYRSPVTRDNRTGKVISGRGRTYKKVEVGLLEPFLFPEVSPEFQKQHLLTSELDYERSRVYLKMTKTTRWRGKKSTEQYEQEIANRDAASYHHLDPLASEGIKGDAKQDGEKFPRFMVKTKGLPSAKHGKILQLLSEERKEERVDELVRKFKQDAVKSSSNTSL